MTIYIDLVFLTNFIGDYLCLSVMQAVCKRISQLRRIIASVIGGVFGVAIILPQFEFLSKLPFVILSGFLISAVAYLPISAKEWLKCGVTFEVSSMILSGACEMFSAFGGIRLILVLLGTVCIVVVTLGVLRSDIYSKRMLCEIKVGKKKILCFAFYDSGNKLTYGENEDAVIVCNEKILKKLFGKEANVENLAEWTDKKIYKVKYGGVGKGELSGLRADAVRVDGRSYKDVIIAFCGNEMNEEMILHNTMA